MSEIQAPPVRPASGDSSARREGGKLFFDLMKHTTTLSTGSVLLVIAFIELFKQEDPEWIWAIMAVYVLFVASILGALLAMLIMSRAVQKDFHTSDFEQGVGILATIFSILCFVGGIASLVAFVAKNLYFPGEA